MGDLQETVFAATVATEAEPASVLLPGHDVPLGRFMTVRRLLPQRPRRMVGAWCFVDQFGPDDVIGRQGMRVPPHPHTGLQTVTWLVAGEVLHRDSLGSVASIRPGEVNLMTAGHGIVHAEESPAVHPPLMQGLQLWIAMPESSRHGPPRFEHHAVLPKLEMDGLAVTVVAGALGAARSPALVHTALLAAEVVVGPGGRGRLPLMPGFEHAALVLDGSAHVAGTALAPGSLLYLGIGREELNVHTGEGARLFLLGGEPFNEPLVMWWNFVARTHEEVVAAREDWAAGQRFGEVTGFNGSPLPAPEMPTTRLKARDRNGLTIG